MTTDSPLPIEEGAALSSTPQDTLEALTPAVAAKAATAETPGRVSFDVPEPTIGRTVYYVNRGDDPCPGEVRPATITRVNGTGGSVNLSVHLDGPNDGLTEYRTANTRWVGSARLDQATKDPGTYHWMVYQLVRKG